jgi:hypothetical protein
LSLYGLCPRFSELAVSLVTFTWVAVIEQVACFMPFSRDTVVLYTYPFE